MKQLLTILLLFSVCKISAQMPDYGLHNLHITDSGKTVRTQIIPVSSSVSVNPMLIYYWYGSNIIHKQQGGYSGKLLNGIYEEYDTNHNLKVQGGFKNGLQDGVWKVWNDSGTLNSIVTWDMGIKTGKFAYYDIKGKEKQSGRYDHDLLDGKIIYNAGTDSGKTVRYNNGKPVPPKNGSFIKRINIFKKKSSKTNQPTQ